MDSLVPLTKDAIADPEELAEKVKVTRNYLTHWNKDLEDEAARGSELAALTLVLRSVMEALLLVEVGFDRDEAGELLERNEDYKQNLMNSVRALNDLAA